MQSISGKRICKITNGVKASQHAHPQGEFETRIPNGNYAFMSPRVRQGENTKAEVGSMVTLRHRRGDSCDTSKGISGKPTLNRTVRN